MEREVHMQELTEQVASLYNSEKEDIESLEFLEARMMESLVNEYHISEENAEGIILQAREIAVGRVVYGEVGRTYPVDALGQPEIKKDTVLIKMEAAGFQEDITKEGVEEVENVQEDVNENIFQEEKESTEEKVIQEEEESTEEKVIQEEVEEPIISQENVNEDIFQEELEREDSSEEGVLHEDKKAFQLKAAVALFVVIIVVCLIIVGIVLDKKKRKNIKTSYCETLTSGWPKKRRLPLYKL